jgi:hypothetical protein
MKTKLSLISAVALLLFVAACKKEHQELQNATFTACPENTSCSYVYVSNANLSSYKIVPGNFRVFQARFQTDYSTTTFRFKTDLAKTNFSITDTNIKAGAVKYLFSCPACDWIGIEPAGGYIKGTKVNNKWLIDGALIMKSVHGLNYSDTVYIKQYFIPATDPEIIIQ